MALKAKILLALTLTNPGYSLPTTTKTKATIPFLPSGFFGPGVSSDVAYQSSFSTFTTLPTTTTGNMYEQPSEATDVVTVTTITVITSTTTASASAVVTQREWEGETTTEYRLPFRQGLPTPPKGTTSDGEGKWPVTMPSEFGSDGPDEVL